MVFTVTRVPDWMILIVTVGAAARLTRIVTRDAITQPLRDFVLFNRDQRRARRRNQALPGPRRPAAAKARAWAHTLITCDWCAGFWISALVAGAYAAWHTSHVYFYVALALTLSYLVGWLAERESPAP